MPLELKPATEADAHRAAVIESIAYGPSPYNAVLFPGPFPGNPKEARAEGLVKSLHEDSTQRWLKVVDPDIEGDEQTIAFAKWHIYTEKPTLAPREFGEGCNIEACKKLFQGIQDQRVRILGDRPYVYLSLLHSDPKQQRRGAGTMLVKWGLEEAQRLGMIAYLDSSEAGYSLYTKLGFEAVELFEVDLSEWGVKEPHKTWSMMWEPTKE